MGSNLPKIKKGSEGVGHGERFQEVSTAVGQSQCLIIVLPASLRSDRRYRLPCRYRYLPGRSGIATERGLVHVVLSVRSFCALIYKRTRARWEYLDVSCRVDQLCSSSFRSEQVYNGLVDADTLLHMSKTSGIAPGENLPPVTGKLG